MESEPDQIESFLNFCITEAKGQRIVVALIFRHKAGAASK
jgi:hypothetical protein